MQTRPEWQPLQCEFSAARQRNCRAGGQCFGGNQHAAVHHPNLHCGGMVAGAVNVRAKVGAEILAGSKFAFIIAGSGFRKQNSPPQRGSILRPLNQSRRAEFASGKNPVAADANFLVDLHFLFRAVHR